MFISLVMRYLRTNNYNFFHILHRSFEMVMEKPALHTCDFPREDPPRIIRKYVYKKNSMPEMQI